MQNFITRENINRFRAPLRSAENEETKAALRRLLKEQEERRADLDASAQPDQKLDSGPCILGGKGKP
jgi:hypothetical protein